MKSLLSLNISQLIDKSLNSASWFSSVAFSVVIVNTYHWEICQAVLQLCIRILIVDTVGNSVTRVSKSRVSCPLQAVLFVLLTVLLSFAQFSCIFTPLTLLVLVLYIILYTGINVKYFF